MHCIYVRSYIWLLVNKHIVAYAPFSTASTVTSMSTSSITPSAYMVTTTPYYYTTTTTSSYGVTTTTLYYTASSSLTRATTSTTPGTTSSRAVSTTGSYTTTATVTPTITPKMVPAMVPGVTVDNDTININGRIVTLTLSWGEPFNNLDPIVNYTVSCSGDGWCPSNFTTTDNTTRSYTITNLTLMTNYTFSVVATNSIGSGEAGVVMITTPPGEVIVILHKNTVNLLLNLLLYIATYMYAQSLRKQVLSHVKFDLKFYLQNAITHFVNIQF